MEINVITKLIFENTKYIAIFFIIAGLIKIFGYYKLFNLPIFNYLNINEVVTLFISNLLAFFVIVLFVCGILVLYKTLGNKWIFVLPILLTIASIGYYFARDYVFVYEIVLINLLFWILFLCIYFLWLNKLNLTEPTDNLNDYFNITIFITLIMFSIFNSFNEFYKVKYLKYYNRVELVIEGVKFIPNDKNYFIGKTQKYLFIHNELESSTRVIPIGKIDEIIYKK